MYSWNKSSDTRTSLCKPVIRRRLKVMELSDAIVNNRFIEIK